MALYTAAWRGNTSAATLPADAALTAGSLTPNTGVTIGVATLTQYQPNEVWTATHSTARADLAAAVANGGYHSVVISRTGGLIPKTLRIKAAKGGSSAPRGFAIRSSVDGYTANLLTSDVTTLRPVLTQYTSADLTALGTQTSITLRIYHYAPTASAAVDFDDLELDYSDVAGTTTAPTVGAGADVASHAVNTVLTRTATETSNGAAITARAWTIVSGPAGAGTTIGTAAALSWTPTVSGSYVLRYSATNSVGAGTDDVAVTVVTPPPTVNAGADVASHTASTAFTRTATETGTGITARAWTIVSGPAGAGTTIGTAAALSWTPTVAGSYVLRYSATNPGGTATDNVSITVVAVAAPSGRVTATWSGSALVTRRIDRWSGSASVQQAATP